MSEKTKCQHMNFDASVGVCRIEDKGSSSWA